MELIDKAKIIVTKSKTTRAMRRTRFSSSHMRLLRLLLMLRIPSESRQRKQRLEEKETALQVQKAVRSDQDEYVQNNPFVVISINKMVFYVSLFYSGARSSRLHRAGSARPLLDAIRTLVNNATVPLVIKGLDGVPPTVFLASRQPTSRTWNIIPASCKVIFDPSKHDPRFSEALADKQDYWDKIIRTQAIKIHSGKDNYDMVVCSTREWKALLKLESKPKTKRLRHEESETESE
jgi:hypothetical protein